MTQDGYDWPAGWQDERWPVRQPGEKTGWPPPELAQDDCRALSRWFASKPDARVRARQAVGEQGMEIVMLGEKV